jgi:uncharacterized protein YndB with AHSA1/START domain
MKPITIETIIHADIQKVWQYWNEPAHITRWCHASDDWECPKAEIDLRVGGSFTSTMAAKDGSSSFDFGGTYNEVIPFEKITYTIGDGRKVEIIFKQEGESVRITETFDPESQNPEDMQRSGWQAILDNFKKHVENN